MGNDYKQPVMLSPGPVVNVVHRLLARERIKPYNECSVCGSTIHGGADVTINRDGTHTVRHGSPGCFVGR